MHASQAGIVLKGDEVVLAVRLHLDYVASSDALQKLPVFPELGRTGPAVVRVIVVVDVLFDPHALFLEHHGPEVQAAHLMDGLDDQCFLPVM